VGPVDHFGQLLGSGVRGVEVWRVLWDLNILLKHPHLYLLLKDVRVASGILGDDFGDGAAPVSEIPTLVSTIPTEEQQGMGEDGRPMRGSRNQGFKKKADNINREPGNKNSKKKI
jgi:hypothetical protein